MTNVVVTLKIMPESPEVDITLTEENIKKKIYEFSGTSEFKTEVTPIAFGLKALNIIFVMDESKGSTENLENEIKDIEGVGSVEVTDVRRAIG